MISKLKFDDTNAWTETIALQQQQGRSVKFNEDEERTMTKTRRSTSDLLTQKGGLSLSGSEREQFDKARRATYSTTTTDEAAAVATSNTSTANVLREKLNQLESEIEKFRRKNAELAERRSQLDAERRLFETERRVFEKERREEVARLREQHDEEMRKLRADKRTFEQYKQSVKDKPSRRERDEIDALKKQVTNTNFLFIQNYSNNIYI